MSDEPTNDPENLIRLSKVAANDQFKAATTELAKLFRALYEGFIAAGWSHDEAMAFVNQAFGATMLEKILQGLKNK